MARRPFVFHIVLIFLPYRQYLIISIRKTHTIGSSAFILTQGCHQSPRISLNKHLSSFYSTKHSTFHSSHKIFPLERPPDPSSFYNSSNHECKYIQTQAQILCDWMGNKTSILCLTGAGMSTESGIPDYRGNRGSYFEGHKPIIHHEFMSSKSMRKRYWARSMLGYSAFANAEPNIGHLSLAYLEQTGQVGVALHSLQNYTLGESCVGTAFTGETNDRFKVSTITQNVDVLHSKGGLKQVVHLHGRGDIVRCMECGLTRRRQEYHDELRDWNRQWIEETTSVIHNVNGSIKLRPDGDAEWKGAQYDKFILPPCPNCGSKCNASTVENKMHNSFSENKMHSFDEDCQPMRSFFKTDVVFFGDNIPHHRVTLATAAIDAADGLFCIGTSLAVHSAYRLAKRALSRGVPVAILNVGETRVEKEGLGDAIEGVRATPLVTKIEGPIGETLNELVKLLKNKEVKV